MREGGARGRNSGRAGEVECRGLDSDKWIGEEVTGWSWGRLGGSSGVGCEPVADGEGFSERGGNSRSREIREVPGVGGS